MDPAFSINDHKVLASVQPAAGNYQLNEQIQKDMQLNNVDLFLVINA